MGSSTGAEVPLSPVGCRGSGETGNQIKILGWSVCSSRPLSHILCLNNAGVGVHAKAFTGMQGLIGFQAENQCY